MTGLSTRFDSLNGELQAMGSIPLLPADDLLDYSRLCEQVFEAVDTLLAHPLAECDPEATAEALYGVTRTMRRAGDDLTAMDLLLKSARFCEARDLRRMASRAHHSAGITLYHLGEYTHAESEFQTALEFLGTDADSHARSIMIELNRGNLLHYTGEFDAAERMYQSVLEAVAAMPGDVFREHTKYAADRFAGLVFNNISANRNDWAEADRATGLRIDRHLSIAEATLREALARPLADAERMQALVTQSHTLILRGQFDLAEVQLRRLARTCAEDRNLTVLLPELYRYSAEACAARGDASQALRDCYRALESSLTLASRLQERKVVDTFVDVLRLSSGVMFDANESPLAKVMRLEGEGHRIVETLVDFLERKDWYTGHNHSKSVSTISLRMARALWSFDGPLGEQARREIQGPVLNLAAKLHDIGKLTVPWSLLNKLLPISPAERAILKTHPAAGKRLLDRVGLAEIGDIVVEHHECPDGSGYPHGKRDSSLMGAIIAVADAFEAMTSINRRYRSPMKKGEAMAEVRAQAGRQFDERVARALEHALNSPSQKLPPLDAAGR